MNYLLQEMRPRQWMKNLILFAGLIFAGKLTDIISIGRVIGAFVAFSLLSSSVYIMNDIIDLERDRVHPIKRNRPLAAGLLPVSHAVVASIILFLLAEFLAFITGRVFFMVSLGYLFLQVAYTFILKHVVILDVLSIAIGFVIRAIAGVAAIDAEISSWLFICTLFLALFLGFCKRRHELILLSDGASNHRNTLGEYSPLLLDQMIAAVTAATLLSYALYTIDEATALKFHTTNLKYTIPFVIYGIFRYLFLVYRKEEGGRPEQVLLTDIPLMVSIFLWAFFVVAMLYREGRL